MLVKTKKYNSKKPRRVSDELANIQASWVQYKTIKPNEQDNETKVLENNFDFRQRFPVFPFTHPTL